MSAAGYLLVGFLVGGGLGLLIGWLWTRGKRAPSQEPLLEELRQQISGKESELGKLRQESQTAESNRASAVAQREAIENQLLSAAADRNQLREEAGTLRGQLETAQTRGASSDAKLSSASKTVEELTAERVQLRGEVSGLQRRLVEAETASGKLSTEVGFLNEKLNTERANIEALQTRFCKEFELVANKLLVENSSRFGQQSAESLDKLLGPLKQNLQEFKTRLDVVHQETVSHSVLLKDQIGRIGMEAANLSKALKGDAKVLGNWGENMLDLILEKSGLQLGVHYRRQTSSQDGDGGRLFLDVVIDLPEHKHLVIDSKVSLKCYEEYVNCVNEAGKGKCLENHIACLRSHFKNLGSKRYHDTQSIAAPDFVLMYVPMEAAFFAAIGEEPGLFSEALDRNVVLTTNSTLLATLRTVAHVWKLADQQKNALEIAERGGMLYDKFAGFVEDLQDVNSSLGRCQDKMSDAISKLHKGKGNLVYQAEQLRELGVKAKKKVAQEFLGGAEESAAPKPSRLIRSQPDLLDISASSQDAPVSAP